MSDRLRAADLGILLVCAIGAFMSFQYQGEIEVRKTWDLPNKDHEREIHVEDWQRLPKPVIADVDGDGKNEIIVVTSEPKVKIFKPQDGYIDVEPFAEASLMSSVRVRSGRQPVALTTGYRSPYKNGYVRRQVIVVLTREWTVLCFDFKLQLLWENNVQQSVKAEFPTNMFLREVAVMVDATPIERGDSGLVVIAGSMAHERENSIYRTRRAEPTLRARRAAEDHNKFRHCAFYAFDGRTGSIRWKHDSTAFNAEESSFKVLKRPQNFKTEATQMSDLGEVDWRVYRRSLLSQLPHSWQRREDTQLRLAHFERRKARRSDIPAAKLIASVPTAHIPGLADWTQAHQQQEHISDPNVLIAHLREGIEVIHLYTGRRLTQFTLGTGVWDDINGDGVVDHAQVFGTQDHADRIADASQETPKCFAEVRTGVPVVGELFNATVCNPEHFDLYTPFSVQRHIEAVHPVTYRAPDRGGSGRDVIFFTGAGQIISFNMHGTQRWEAETLCAWDASRQGESIEELQLFPLHDGLQEQYLLAVAPQAFAVVHPDSGSVVTEMELPEELALPVTIGDIDNDGMNDFLFTSATSIHAYVVRRRPSSVLFQLLIGSLIVVILGVLLFGLVGSAAPAKMAKD